MDKDKIKKVLQRCSAVGFKTSRSNCPDCYRSNDLLMEAVCIITEQEKEIEQLTRELAKEQETCGECETKQSWELFVRDKEIDRLRAVAKEILQRLYDKCYEVQGLREGYAHIIPLDILILAKEYGVEVEE